MNNCTPWIENKDIDYIICSLCYYINKLNLDFNSE